MFFLRELPHDERATGCLVWIVDQDLALEPAGQDLGGDVFGLIGRSDDQQVSFCFPAVAGGFVMLKEDMNDEHAAGENDASGYANASALLTSSVTSDDDTMLLLPPPASHLAFFLLQRVPAQSLLTLASARRRLILGRRLLLLRCCGSCRSQTCCQGS